MTKLITKVLISSLALCLSACASNTPHENQAIGAATGAAAGVAIAANSGPTSTGLFTVIGTGAIVGALIGYSWGDPMDKSDKAKAYQAIAAGKPATWQNPSTKATYTVIPAKTMVRFAGNPNCRQFSASQSIADEKARTISRTACQGSQGDWELVH